MISVERPLVSVLMTAYNREKYIAEAIESVLDSSYSNFELIIVDDGSSDQTVEIAHSFEKIDGRIRVYINEVNLGDYPNRNKAASYAKGKYLKYVDADDRIYPWGLEILVRCMQKFPKAGYGLCSLSQDIGKPYPFELDPQEAYERHYSGNPIFHKAPLSTIIKKSVFDNVGGFTGKRMLGDFEMWHLLSQKHNVVLMPHGLVWYREHGEQEMEVYRQNPEQPFSYKLLSLNLLQSPLCPLKYEHKETAIQKCKQTISRSIVSAFRRNGINKGLQLMKMADLSFLQFLKYVV